MIFMIFFSTFSWISFLFSPYIWIAFLNSARLIFGWIVVLSDETRCLSMFHYRLVSYMSGPSCGSHKRRERILVSKYIVVTKPGYHKARRCAAICNVIHTSDPVFCIHFNLLVAAWSKFPALWQKRCLAEARFSRNRLAPSSDKINFR